MENVSHAYGYYLTDAQWPELGSIFAMNGNKLSPFAGYYLGRDRIKAAATAMYGTTTTNMRPSIPITGARSRSFSSRTTDARPSCAHGCFSRVQASRRRTAVRSAAGLAGGMYNDQAVLEDGIWRLWTVTIDEHYFNSAGWKGGWAAVEAKDSPRIRHQPTRRAAAARHPADQNGAPRRAFSRRSGQADRLARHPAHVVQLQEPGQRPRTRILLAGFGDESHAPQSRLIANGYQMPPTGPDIDGIPVELTRPGSDKMDDK